MHRPVQPSDEVLGLPASCISRLCRRWIFESPRISHPFGGARDNSPGYPEFSFLQRRLAMRLRVSPQPASSGCAEAESPGRPESSLLRQCRRVIPRVAPPLRSVSCAAGWISESPRIPYPAAAPSMRLRVAPTPASTAGPMMTPRLDSNFASSAEPRMNLRVQSGPAHSCLTLDAILSQSRPSTCQTSRPVNCLFQAYPASSCQAGTAYPNFLQGHQLRRRLGPFNLWMQVQKTASLVDFTRSGA
jgi:hypothetical protein